MATLAEAVNNAFAKVKRESMTTRWLKGHLYEMVKTRSKQDGTSYFWVDDSGKKVSVNYRSREMAEVHFGDFFRDQ